VKAAGTVLWVAFLASPPLWVEPTCASWCRRHFIIAAMT